jgi:hypothetical protein
MNKLILLLALALAMPTAFADEHHGRHEREYREHRGHDSDAGWFLGGLVLGAIIVDASRPQEPIPPFRRGVQCKDYIIVERDGYEHMERRCHEVMIPVEE